MTKNEYLLFKLKPQEDRTHTECAAADGLIKTATLVMFAHWCNNNITDRLVRMFLVNTVRAHFGSVDVDHMLTELKCYPEWI